MTFNLIIFDNDGVLIDSEVWIKKAMLLAIAEQNAHVTLEWTNAHTQGRGWDATIKEVSKYTGVNIDFDRFMADYTTLAHDLFAKHLAPIAGVPDIFEPLDQRGTERCVATSATRKEITHKYSLTGARSTFSARPHLHP